MEDFVYQSVKGLKDSGPDEISGFYISLSRAVLFGSKDDAGVYFEEAIDIVSKFGDEIVERWKAVVSLSKQASIVASDELAYRFIRCAELVGEYVNREKHWDRSEAILTCAEMSPQMTISALSRWRDREVGRFEYQLESLLIYLVKSRQVKAPVGWSLNRFLSDHHLNSFLCACLENTTSDDVKTQLFNDAVDLLSKSGTDMEHWKKLKSISSDHQINSSRLDDIIGFYESQTLISNQPEQNKRSEHKSENRNWNQIFKDNDLTTTRGISIVIKRFFAESDKANSGHHHLSIYDVLKESLNRIKAHQVNDFITALLDVETLSSYEVVHTINLIPDTWKNKISFKKKWPKIVHLFGQKYSHDLVSSYSLRSTVRDLNLDESLLSALKKGICQGLSQGQRIESASSLFGFARIASEFVSETEAVELSSYALSRFELHTEDDFGDGQWAKWLLVSDNVSSAIAGFIWSALGSPYSATRWQACHAIKILAEFNCILVMDSLINWLEKDTVDAFGSDQFMFYNLHARQYLLIAMFRFSVDQPSLLAKHKQIFLKYARFESHIMIQKLAVDIALNIEKAIPNTYNSSELSLLNDTNQRKEGVPADKYSYRVDSYLHSKGAVDTTLDYHFGMDFGEYWCAPMGRVFGISQQQVEDLCANVIVKEWKLGSEWGYKEDSRVGLWNQSSDRDIDYYKEAYPKADNWDFYKAYHSMMTVTARLLNNMPVLLPDHNDYEEDYLNDWFFDHLPTRIDGKWLADNRGSLPLSRPQWLAEERNNEWVTETQNQDFLNIIQHSQNNEEWLHIKGGWTERDSYRHETYTVSSALVSKNSSEALLRALTFYSDTHGFRLPNYKESDMEFDWGVFKLKGWVDKPYFSKGIDEKDPYAKNIDYPPFEIGDFFESQLGLTRDEERKRWYFNDGTLAADCNAWSSAERNRDEEPTQSGMRLSVSLKLLQELCKANNCDLIISVMIDRGINYNSRPENYEYPEDKHCIYLFSENGKITSA